MKKLVSLAMLMVFVLSMLAACGPDPIQQAAQQMAGPDGQQMMQGSGGMDPLAAGAIGAAGGLLAGKLLSGGSRRPQVIHQTNIIQRPAARYYKRSYSRPSYRSSFGGGRRR